MKEDHVRAYREDNEKSKAVRYDERERERRRTVESNDDGRIVVKETEK